MHWGQHRLETLSVSFMNIWIMITLRFFAVGPFVIDNQIIEQNKAKLTCFSVRWLRPLSDNSDDNKNDNWPKHLQ